MSKEAMKLALEALETYKGFIDDAHILEGQWHWLDGLDNVQTALREALAEQPAQQEPVAWADECRIELVNAIHFLASDFENALGAFGGDTEARRKAKGDIAHARSIASRWNWNGTSTPAQRKPLTLGEIAKALADAGLRPEDYREDGMMEPLVRAIEAAHGIKGDA